MKITINEKRYFF